MALDPDFLNLVMKTGIIFTVGYLVLQTGHIVCILVRKRLEKKRCE